MEMLCASRPTWMWKTQSSVAANIRASSHQGMCRPIGASGGLATTLNQKALPTTARIATSASTRRVGRLVRRDGWTASGAGCPVVPTSAPSARFRARCSTGVTPRTRREYPCSVSPSWSLPRSPWLLLNAVRQFCSCSLPPCACPVSVSPGGSGPGGSGPGGSGPGGSGPGGSGPGGSGPGGSGPGGSGPGGSGPGGAGPRRSGPRRAAPLDAVPRGTICRVGSPVAAYVTAGMPCRPAPRRGLVHRQRGRSRCHLGGQVLRCAEIESARTLRVLGHRRAQGARRLLQHVTDLVGCELGPLRQH